MSDLSDVKSGMIIGARLAGASVSRTAYFVGISRTTVSRVVTVSTNLDNARDEYPPSKTRTHENYSAEVACCQYSWRSSYTKTITFGLEL
ncbi:hypothetical protein NPIL_670361 [Nephila pilipes]|uniref:Uncharacterized protein n=1 Tax=Nephila pilipes TaxID=299642 RepID=A0A8X6U064_NEPPI|nr:hypothetical protein NPIL_670361 [Nephila pilipes]